MKAWEKFKIMQEALPLLGTMTDTALAKKLGVKMASIRRWREQAGIASWHEQQKAAVLPLLGTMTDREVVELTGVSQPTIVRWRRAAGIKPVAVTTKKELRARIKELEAEVTRLQNLNKEKAQ